MRWMGLVLMAMVALAATATGTVRHVPSEYATIQAGMDAADPGDTVLVADGTYTGDGNRDIDFNGKPIVVISENGPESCTIDCEGSYEDPHRGFYFHSEEDSTSVVQGFTITNGWALDGGGVACDSSSSPTIIGNTISRNMANIGGGILCYNNPSSISSPIIEGNIITINTAYYAGGGIYCSWYSSPIFRGNTITGNIAIGGGGGIYSMGYSRTIERNTINNNTADWGGGIGCDRSSPIIEGNTIIDNIAYKDGGGIHCYDGSSPTIQGNTIADNTACDGGGIYCYDSSSPTIQGNTITENTADDEGGGISCTYNSSPTILNSILWADSASTGPEIYVDGTSSIEVTYSDIQDGWEGEGNINADPFFVLSEHRDCRLLWSSPCIDSGHPDSLDPDGSRSDIGAFYFDQSTPLTIYLTPNTTTVRRHEELGVTYTVINIVSDSLTFTLQSDVYLPNGKPYPGNPIVGPTEVTLAENETKQRHISHQVPGSALLGTYTYKSTLSFSAKQLVDEDSFAFQVYPIMTVRHVPSEYSTIQAGIDPAYDGDTVLVAPGIYTGDGNRDIDFKGKQIVLISENGPEETVIDCEGSEEDPHRGFYFHSGEDSNAVVRGFTITNGYVSEHYWPQCCGGAILCDFTSSPSIKGNKIILNTARRGGGIFCGYTIRGRGKKNLAAPLIVDNIIADNPVDPGRRVKNYNFSPTIQGNTITGNRALDYGGGISCGWHSSPTIVGNTITGNMASADGGGICCYDDSHPIVLNSILWADSAGMGQEIYVSGDSSIDITYSDIQGGWEGEGNIDADPLFVLPEHRDFRLLWGSPCIDTGHPDSLDPDGTRSDMGAFPFDQSHPLTIYLTPDTTLIVRPGELGVTYTLINIEPNPWTFWLRSDVTLPNGKPYPGNPIIGPKKVTLPGSKNVQRYVTHPIPGAAPLGIYTYKSRIGLPPDQLIDEDSFEFEVVEE